MKFKVGDKIKYRGFLVKRDPGLEGVFVVYYIEKNKDGRDLICAHGMQDRLVCSEEFESAE